MKPVTTGAGLPESLSGILDSTLALSPDGPGLHVASAGLGEQPLIGRLAVHDTDLPLLRGSSAPLTVVLGGGAGQIAGPAGLCAKLGLNLAGIGLSLRDYDDLAGNVRRVGAALTAARDAGTLRDDVPVCLDLPITEAPFGWQGALDEAAALEVEVGFRLGGPRAPVPSTGEVASWIDATLDRETPFRITAGIDRAVGTGSEFGLLNLLVATQAAWDGASPAEVAAVLGETDGPALAAAVGSATSARRWLRSCASSQIDAIAAELSVLPPFA